MSSPLPGLKNAVLLGHSGFATVAACTAAGALAASTPPATQPSTLKFLFNVRVRRRFSRFLPFAAVQARRVYDEMRGSFADVSVKADLQLELFP